MAAGGIPPEEVPPDIYYACHPKTVNSTVVCILCDRVFHKSEFNRIKEAKYVTNVLVICDEHPEVNITSDDSEIPRVLVSTLKKELQVIKNENNLLKELNSEIKNKNVLLEEMLASERKMPKINKTYAEITTKQILPCPQVIPKIVVKRINKEDTTDMAEKVLYHLNKDKTIQTRKVNVKNKDEIIINCMNTESAKTAEKLLDSKLHQLCKVEKEQLNKPVIKITGFENIFGMDNETIESDINTRNFETLGTKGKVLNMSTNNRNYITTIYMAVTPEMHKHIRENKDRIFVGHQNCRVYDVINVKPCYKCCRFGHSGVKCENPPECLKCAGAHLTKNCKGQKQICCANCSYINDKYNKKHNTEHVATDSEKCEILKNKIRAFLKSTDYTIKPNIPRYFGKVDDIKDYRQKVNNPTKPRSPTGDGGTDNIAKRTRFGATTSISTLKTAISLK